MKNGYTLFELILVIVSCVVIPFVAGTIAYLVWLILEKVW